MKLTQLNLTNFRNFASYEFKPNPRFNLIVADNGCGKTSLLEAIYYLGMGRSFRSYPHQPVIQHGKTFCQIIGEFIDNNELPLIIGIEKHQDSNKSQLKISGREANGTAELAKLLPIQLVHHETFHLLDAGPQHRREFLDWGVFYAEPLYFTAWQRFQRALKQRNALLKNFDSAQMDFWEYELATQGSAIDQFRRMYLTLLLPVLDEVLQPLTVSKDLSINYHAGWDNQRDYLNLLQRNRQRDAILGYTQNGPHRADLRIKINQHDTDHVLSRGQQKMFSFVMRVAQALLLSRLSQQQSLFLIDDLAAELDANHIGIAFEILAQLPCQTFITAVHSTLFQKQMNQYDLSLFHVEQQQ